MICECVSNLLANMLCHQVNPKKQCKHAYGEMAETEASPRDTDCTCSTHATCLHAVHGRACMDLHVCCLYTYVGVLQILLHMLILPVAVFSDQYFLKKNCLDSRGLKQGHGLQTNHGWKPACMAFTLYILMKQCLIYLSLIN